MSDANGDSRPSARARADYTSEETYGLTRASVDRASTLLPEAYREQDFFVLEQERVFADSWVCVGYASQVRETGDCFTAIVAGQPILVTRDRSGSLRSFYNVCRHRGSQLLSCDT
jgi:choline monooxygenase